MRDRVSLVLNGHRVEIAGLEPTTTLLQWLRRERRLTGTKVGCNEGDCGACTVVVGALVDGVVRYSAINACIAFVPMLEGKLVLTVESLRGPDGALHPVQQAMVDCHGSQCGFCTPGFVMSLYALYLNQRSAPSRADINTWLAGNLCRCTGYGPIAAAATTMFDAPRPAWDDTRRAADAAALQALAHDETLEIASERARLFAPASLDALAALYAAHPDATLVSGATDVGLWVTKQARTLPVMIATNRVRDVAFTSVEQRAKTWWIGAGATHAAAAALPSPPLQELWRRFAGPQVRNTGTVGGNIANGSPIGDLAPAFIALGATLHLRKDTQNREIPLEDFFLAYGNQDRAPGEFIYDIEVSKPASIFAVHKVSKRFDDDISAVCGAFNIALRNGHVVSARIAYGGMAAIPKRASHMEAALTDKPWTRATIDAAMSEAARDFTPIDDMRASASYRLDIAQNLLLRVYLEHSDTAAATRLVGATAAFGV